MLSCSLAPLRTSGNRILNFETVTAVRLKGVNRSGLEYSSPTGPGSLARAGICAAEFDEIASWGANVVRVPFNQAWALSRAVYDAEAYLACLDQAISIAAERGMYTLLDLQWLDSTTPRGHLASGRMNFVPPLPDLSSIRLWQQLARRYRHEPAVLYDVFNEPHDPLPDDTEELHGLHADGSSFVIRNRSVRLREWRPWAARLVSAVRSEHPAALIFVSGLDWGYDLEGFPLPELQDVVYSSHVYRNKTKSWGRAFGNLSRLSPVFIAEWGGCADDLGWGAELLQFLNEREIGWAAWSWSDEPRLVRQDSRYEPTEFGKLVQDSLGGIGV